MITASPDAKDGQTRLIYWLLQALGWGTLATATVVAASFLPDSIPDAPRIPLARSLPETCLLFGIALAASHYLRLVMIKKRWRALPNRTLAFKVVCASLIAGTPVGMLHQQLDIAVIRGSVSEQALGGYLLQISNWTITFVIWCALYLLITHARSRREEALRHSETQRALQQAELSLLKSQLNPHFLFNSLNSVRALIADDPAAAQQAITKLSRTLRYTLGAGKQDLVSLREELSMVEDYLELEALRLGNRLKIEKDIAETALEHQIPVMLLQTLVENAIKHGIAELTDGGTLHITARSAQDKLMIDISNPCPPQPASKDGEGVGLRNSTERLRLLYGSRAQLQLDLATPGHALTRLQVPQSP